jgi:hypothetical protein
MPATLQAIWAKARQLANAISEAAGTPGPAGPAGAEGLNVWTSATAIAVGSTAGVNVDAIAGRTLKVGDLVISTNNWNVGRVTTAGTQGWGNTTVSYVMNIRGPAGTTPTVNSWTTIDAAMHNGLTNWGVSLRYNSAIKIGIVQGEFNYPSINLAQASPLFSFPNAPSMAESTVHIICARKDASCGHEVLRIYFQRQGTALVANAADAISQSINGGYIFNASFVLA